MEAGQKRCLLLALCCALAGCAPPAELARRQLEKAGISVNAAAAVTAAGKGDTRTLELLRVAGVDITGAVKPGAETPLVAAVKANSAAVGMLLVATPPEKLDAVDAAGRTVLSHALEAGAEGTALELLKRGAKVERTTHPGRDLISTALAGGRRELVEKLIAGCEPGAPVLAGAMLSAAEAGDVGVMTLLAGRGAPVEMKSADGESLIAMAVRRQDAAMVKMLLGAGVKPGAVPVEGARLLGLAVGAGNVELAAQLLEAGCGAEVPDAAGRTAVVAAREGRVLGALAFFLKKGADAQAQLEPALAARDLEVVDMLLAHGAKLDATDAEENPPLVRAVTRGEVELTQYLLRRGAPAGQTGRAGQTAFSLAVARGDLQLVEALLDAGVDAGTPFRSPASGEFLALTRSDYFNGWMKKDERLSPLMLAAARGETSMVRLLLARGAKRGQQTKNWKRYAVNFACEKEHIECAQALLGREADNRRNVKAIISLSDQRATVYKNGKAVRSTDISSGRSGFDTPSGAYVISDKQEDWESSIYKVPMPYFMRLSCRDFGLHAGYVTGRPASHGCVRLPKDEAEVFFSLMQIGDPVIIEE